MADPHERNGENERKPGSADDADLSARLKSLDARISQASAQRAESEPRARPKSDSNALGQAFRLSAEFVAGVAAGGILGWIVDYNPLAAFVELLRAPILHGQFASPQVFAVAASFTVIVTGAAVLTLVRLQQRIIFQL